MHGAPNSSILHLGIAVDIFGSHLEGPDASGSFFMRQKKIHSFSGDDYTETSGQCGQIKLKTP